VKQATYNAQERAKHVYLNVVLILSLPLFVCCLFVQGASAPTGDGLYEGLDWLSNTLSKRNN